MNERMMTKGTFDYYTERKNELRDQLTMLGDEAIGSGHQSRAMLHDDASTSYLTDSTRQELERIGSLENVKLIKPKEDISTVGIGNKVFLKYGNNEEEPFTVLGRDDVTNRNDLGEIISEESPIGILIMGKKSGDSVLLKVRNNNFNVTITKIEKGDFE